MIALLGASAIFLTGLQATINAPRDAFRACIKQAGTKAAADKVGADAYEAYVRAACTAEQDKLRSALIAFSLKNGMAKKAANSDAELTIGDYVSSFVEKYKFVATMNAPAKPAATQPTATVQATPAAAPQPTKE
jgi:hypothetical protein